MSNTTLTNGEVRKALQKSIAKWRRVAKGVPENGIEDCALCGLFYVGGCQGCPIKEHTGLSDCAMTAYIDWFLQSDDTPDGFVAISSQSVYEAHRMKKFLMDLDHKYFVEGVKVAISVKETSNVQT